MSGRKVELIKIADGRSKLHLYHIYPPICTTTPAHDCSALPEPPPVIQSSPQEDADANSGSSNSPGRVKESTGMDEPRERKEGEEVKDVEDVEATEEAPYDPFAEPEGSVDGDVKEEDKKEAKKDDNDNDDDNETNAIDASVATLKPTSTTSSSSSSSSSSKPSALQFLSAEATAASTASTTYVDPTPATPIMSRSPSTAASHTRSPRSDPEAGNDTDVTDGEQDRRYLSDDENGAGTRGGRREIQTIMEQFSGDGGGPGVEEVMSPRLEIASPMLSAPLPSHPPRKSSLEPLAPGLAQHIKDSVKEMGQAEGDPAATDKGKGVDSGPPVPPKDESLGAAVASAVPPSAAASVASPKDDDTPLSPTVSLHRPPPPEPEPEPVLPFDFHRFLEQLRHKKADPVARYLKSFLAEFAKKQWMVHEQVKIISDFLAFIANKMAVCEVWRDLSDAEFDNAREGMEKLVMNRLYAQTFSPAIPPPQPIPGAKPKRRGGERPMGPGRRGQHQEDVERDEILSQKISIYAWIREEHLDIAPVAGESGRRFLRLAQQELLKIKTYRAPRDKIICVLNCCKVIFGLLKHNKADSSADSFMPLLIYVVLQANPDHLVSNVQYILRFRNQDKLGGEAGYYLSSLMGAVQFIENMDRTTLTITDEEFEANVEAAVSAIAEKHRAQSPPLPIPPADKDDGEEGEHGDEGGEKGSEKERPNSRLSATHASGAGPSAARPRTPRPTSSAGANPSREGDGGDAADADDEKDAITGLLRTIQRPLSTIGRLFSDEPASPTAAEHPRGRSPGGGPPQEGQAQGLPLPPDGSAPRRALSAEEAAARQASAETAEAQRLHRVEHANVVETLAGMFPDLDRDIISDVVYQKEGRVGLAVDACLALSS
ncbi:hypothetical protein SBRCBS47491_001906 [Sporothrix bragantina]|uniref:Vacuolar protein sorting-associated protein 9a n=1 Tax=Sporothrix bragantina TaxID=671064 RepID=A0ABP0B2I8_9PEZI